MKKATSLFLAFMLMFGSFTNVFAGTSLDDAMKKERLYAKGTGTQLLKWNGIIDATNFAPTIVVYQAADGKEYPAYCIMPNKPGVDQVSGKSYEVGVDEAISDPHVWGIITNGHPYKTPQELGVNNEYEAYYITKMSIWCAIHDNYSDINDWTANGAHNQHVEDAMKALYAKGMATASMPQTTLTATPLTPIAEVDGDFLVQTFTVTSNTTVKSYSVTFDGDHPSDAKITDEQGNEKSTFNTGDKFKVKLSKTGIKRNGSFSLKITAQVENKSILWGQSYNANTQDYAVVPQIFSDFNSTATASYKEDDGIPTPDAPDPTPTPESGTIQIKKVKAGTTQRLAGAEFRVTDATGGVIGHFYSDGNGQVTIPVDKLGAYYIDELTPPAGYQLDIMNHKDVVVRTDEPAIVVFENKPSAGLEITKVDADTGEKLAGATIRVALDGGHESFDVQTDASGTARLQDLKDGTYTVTEITAPLGYILDTTPHPIKLEASKVSTIILKNKAKPGLLIKKYDEGTGYPLENAEFSIAKKGGSIIYEGMTNKAGQIKLEGLAEGWYTVTEIAAPPGYLIATESKDVYLESNKVAEIKFDNRLRPSLQIMKIDSQTGKPLAGAKFTVRKTEDLTVSEYITDASGTIIIYDLDEAIYTVVEVKSPDGYLLDPQHVDIKLEWGKTKTLVFENKAKPSLEILKIDEASKEPLAGAKFRVTRTEGNTTSEYVTDESGRILIEGLADEIYSISEIVAPDGYILEEQHKDVQLEWGVRKTVVFTNKKRPVLVIKKIDTITGEPLKNARFKVTKTEDKTVSEYVTDETGVITINKLDESIYTVEEILAPDGWILDPQHKEIALEWGKTKTLVYEDTKKPTLIITKTNGLTYKPIPDTTYKIEYEGANGGVIPLGTYRTDKNGQIIIPKVNVGWYIVTETRPAPGFSLSSNPVKRVYLAPGENSYLSSAITDDNGSNTGYTGNEGATGTVQITYGSDYTPTIVNGEEIINFPLNSIVIKKTHAKTGEMLDGAVFEVRKVSEDISGNSGTIIGRYTTNHSGIVVITGLDAGAYIVEEVQAPQNFLLSENSKQEAWLKPDGTSIVSVTFANYPYGSILVTKVDALTGKPLSNARFKVTDGTGAATGNTNGEFVTNTNGEFLVENVKPGAYVVTELEAPPNYVRDTTPQTITVGTDGKVYKLSFQNQPVGTLVIKKLHSVTKEPLSGAEFKVTTAKGDVVGTGNGIYTTNATGTITIPNLEKGSYIIMETKAPNGFILENQTQTIEIEYGKTHTVEFFNKPKSSMQIIKIDSETKHPLKDAKFTVYKMNGEVLGHYVTDGDGLIILDNLEPSWYKIVETKAPDGYIADDTPRDVELSYNQFLKVTFENKKLTSLIVKKVNDKTGEPLAGAMFSVERQDGRHIGEFSTDKDGLINLPTLDPDFYIIREIKAPDGFLLDESPKTVEVKTNVPTVITFTNKKLTALEIKKVNEKTGEPLAGAKFAVEKQDGQRIGEYTTDVTGLISIPTLDPDWYVVREVKAPDGFLLDETPKTVEVKTNAPTVVTFVNKRLAALQIKKVDEITGAPLAGAVFKVTKQNGEVIGDAYVTDKDGFIQIPALDPGYYTVSEMKAPQGYVLDNAPKTVEVKTNIPTSVTFSNKPLSGLKIIKLNSVTREPIPGVEFAVAKTNGERIGNFKTDSIGQIYIAALEDGYYTVTEIKGADGFIMDKEPKTVQIQWGRPTILEVLNDPFPALVIKKTSAEDKKPLAGVKFLVTKFNGEQIGYYTTDRAGMIVIEGLEEGKYLVRETEAQKGFILDETAHEVDIKYGKRFTLEIENKKMASILIRKIDSVTKEGIYGVKFLLYDEKDNPLGQFTSDDQGYVWLDKELPTGKYKLRELEPADGYLRDDIPRTIYLGEGQTTHVTWENTPQKGQILITKRSSTFNEVTGLPAGSPLAGASFEIYNTTGNIVDKMVSDARGIAASKPLPMGVYFIKEVSAPRYYAVNSKELWAEIKHNGDIVRFEFFNESITLNLTIQKKGPNGAAPGQTIRYDLYEIANKSSVALENFYIHDRIPTDATRAKTLVTGTYSERMYYKVTYKTNQRDYRVLAENLLTKNSYEFSLHPNALGLAAGEYVTDVRLEFPKASPGFKSVDNMVLFCEVMPTVPKDYNIVNRADTGGRVGNEWESAKTSWNTKVWAQDVPAVPLPKTGY